MPSGVDLAAAAAAGAAHGQIASPMPDGIALSGHKLVDEGARALLLILPGVLRIDVRPLPDGLQVVSDYGKTAEETVQPSLVGFRIAVWTGEVPLGGRLLLAYTRDHEGGPTHFVGHAVLQEVQADR